MVVTENRLRALPSEAMPDLVYSLHPRIEEIKYQFPHIQKADLGPIMVAYAALCGYQSVQTERALFHTIHAGVNHLGGIGIPYNVAISDRASQDQRAIDLAEELKEVNNPWGRILGIAEDLFIKKLGLDGVPPVTAVIASKGDFRHGRDMTHGKWVSVVTRGLRLGKAESVWDIMLPIVFGSRAWKETNRYQYGDGERYLYTLEHELTHFLTTVYLIGKDILTGKHLGGDVAVMELLSWPIWESIAEILSGLLEEAQYEQMCYEEKRGDIPLEETIAHKVVRKLGEIPLMLDVFYFGLLLRRWKGERLEVLGWDIDKSQKATVELLEKMYGRWKELPKGEKNGWLVKQVFREDGFDWQEAVREINWLMEEQMMGMLSSLFDLSGGREIAKILLEQQRRYGGLWNPFGKDSLRR